MPVMLGGGNSEKLSRCYLGDQLLVGGECGPSGNMLFRYKFANDLKDYSGNGYNLTASGSYTQNNGYITLSSAKLYNSSSSLVCTPNSKAYTFACTLRNFGTQNECWVYQADSGVCSTYFNGSPEGGYIKILSITNGYNRNTSVGYVMKGPFHTSYNDSDAGINVSILGNDWKKIICTYDPSITQLKIYCNGSLIHTLSKSAGTASNNTGVAIGYCPYGSYCDSARHYIGDMKNLILSEGVWGDSDINWYNSLQ